MKVYSVHDFYKWLLRRVSNSVWKTINFASAEFQAYFMLFKNKSVFCRRMHCIYMWNFLNNADITNIVSRSHTTTLRSSKSSQNYYYFLFLFHVFWNMIKVGKIIVSTNWFVSFYEAIYTQVVECYFLKYTKYECAYCWNL